MTNLLVTRQAYNNFAYSAGKTPETFKFNKVFLNWANHVGILEETGMVTLIKDRTLGRRECNRAEWNHRVKI